MNTTMSLTELSFTENTYETQAMKETIDKVLERVATKYPELSVAIMMTVEHVCNNMTLKALAAKYSTTENKVRGRVAHVLRRLRHPANSKDLRGFYEG